MKLFNGLLLEYARNHDDVTIAFHHNLRDTNWSMFSDAKHIYPNKIAKYAANIIKALKQAYNITDKSSLFLNHTARPTYQQRPLAGEKSFNRPIGAKLSRVAGYSLPGQYLAPYHERWNEYSTMV